VKRLFTLLLAFTLISVCISNNVLAQQANILLSPLQQIRLGVLPENIKCSENLLLVFSPQEGHPGCVKMTTAEKLFPRGWTHMNNPSTLPSKITLNGTIEKIITDCAPPAIEPAKHCVYLQATVLRATNGHSFALSNLNFSSQLQNKQLQVVGLLSIPSKSNMTFIAGDVDVINYSFIGENPIIYKK
jgi:hypothetical protein